MPSDFLTIRQSINGNEKFIFAHNILHCPPNDQEPRTDTHRPLADHIRDFSFTSAAYSRKKGCFTKVSDSSDGQAVYQRRRRLPRKTAAG